MAQQEHSNIKCYISAFRYIVGALGPGVHYLLVYWACGPSQERGFVQEKSLLEETMLVNKEVSFGHNGSTRWSEDKCLLG